VLNLLLIHIGLGISSLNKISFLMVQVFARKR
jgi:hypothetical protein